jgi:hypothetical protein
MVHGVRARLRAKELLTSGSEAVDGLSVERRSEARSIAA